MFTETRCIRVSEAGLTLQAFFEIAVVLISVIGVLAKLSFSFVFYPVGRLLVVKSNRWRQ